MRLPVKEDEGGSIPSAPAIWSASSVVERSLDMGEAGSSILSLTTTCVSRLTEGHPPSKRTNRGSNPRERASGPRSTEGRGFPKARIRVRLPGDAPSWVCSSAAEPRLRTRGRRFEPSQIHYLMPHPLVVHHRRPHDVFIGRPSKWGNPFVIGRDGTREQVIAKYRRWIMTQPHLLAALPELAHKRLGCYCAPRPCHGDVLAALSDARIVQRQDAPFSTG